MENKMGQEEELTPEQENEMTRIHDMTVELQILFKTRDFEKINHLTKCENYKAAFLKYSWEILTALGRRLREKELTPEAKEEIEQITIYIAEITDPEECLIEFLEQFEESRNDTAFTTFLKALQKVMLRLNENKNWKKRNLEWCLNAIQVHLTSLAPPDNYGLDNEEAPLMDSDPKAIRILVLYDCVYDFIIPFLKLREELDDEQRIILICFVIQLLGQPLGFLDMAEGDTTPPARLIADRVLNVVEAYNSDLLLFLKYAEEREKYNFEKEKEDDVFCEDYFSREDKLPLFGIAVFYYLIFGEGAKVTQIPYVYSTEYITRICLFLSAKLLNQSGEYVFQKGIVLAEKSLSKIKENSLNLDFLELNFNQEFVENLTRVMIYSQTLSTRKKSLEIFKSYLDKFSLNARYWLLLNLRPKIKHSGLCGYIITYIKELVLSLWNENATMFKGKLLFDLIFKWCDLPELEKTDLVDNFDKIVASINIIRYLVIRDRNSNISGIWNSILRIKKDLIQPIRSGIKLTRAHYEFKMEELKKEPKNKETWQSINLTIKVGDEELPNIPYKEKLNILLSGLNAIDLIESLIVRVEECINETEYIPP